MLLLTFAVCCSVDDLLTMLFWSSEVLLLDLLLPLPEATSLLLLKFSSPLSPFGRGGRPWMAAAMRLMFDFFFLPLFSS